MYPVAVTVPNRVLGAAGQDAGVEEGTGRGGEAGLVREPLEPHAGRRD
jgi:hypothetical protein